MKLTTGLSVLALTIGATAEDKWENPDGGNTRADIGDRKVNYGYTPPWYVFDKIKEECASTGCNSEHKIEHSTGVIQDGEMKSATIVCSVEGTFNDPDEPGNLDDLVELVKAVAGASPYDFEAGVSYRVGNGCVTSGFTPCDPGNEEHADQYTATSLIVVRTEHESGDAYMSVSVKVDVDDAGSGVCSAITTVGAGMSSAVSGLASGIFVLAGLACG
ncbi:hypothetical protein FSARC_6427 [Fusarium sarcochroum]|uniref:Uncharacterized protein n=1 Tax=Fusarium sarcochroum TaxID=1208366 RepID=A0A8H4TXH7_9HYPO|nr:hypothetical protein FSARC_6427 [Fusarium sarcochroum]